MSSSVERRARRAQGQQLLDQLSTGYADRPGVDRAVMFGSTGLRVGGTFFAFVGAEGELIVKVPAEQAAELVGSGAATPVRIGRNPAREWVGITLPASHEGSGAWPGLLSDACTYVEMQTSTSR